jgi:hypothetical protein
VTAAAAQQQQQQQQMVLQGNGSWLWQKQAAVACQQASQLTAMQLQQLTLHL